MLHIFWVHSHITYLVSKKIISIQNILVGNCIFLLSRGYEIDDSEIFTIESPFYLNRQNEDLSKTIFFEGQILKTRKRIKQAQSFLYEITGKKTFLFYACHNHNDMVSVITSSKYCKGFFYIEEGLASYLEVHPRKLNLFRQFFKCFFPIYRNFYKALRVSANPSFFNINHPKFLKAYGISDKTFYWLKPEQRTTIGLPFVRISNKPKYDAIIVFDGLVVSHLIKEETQYHIIEDYIFPFLRKKNYKQIGYKLHPEQYSREEAIQIRKLFNKIKNNCFVQELNSKEILENYAYSFHSDIICFMTSTAVYASFCGSKVYSFLPYISKIEPNADVAKWVEKIPYKELYLKTPEID